MTVRGVFAGALSLTALQAVLSTDASAKRTGQLFTWFASAVYRTMSPNVPLIPDRRQGGRSDSGSTTATPGGSGSASLSASQFMPVAPIPTRGTGPVPTPTPGPAPVIAPSSYSTT